MTIIIVIIITITIIIAVVVIPECRSVSEQAFPYKKIGINRDGKVNKADYKYVAIDITRQSLVVGSAQIYQ